jgi:hypothetical protein
MNVLEQGRKNAREVKQSEKDQEFYFPGSSPTEIAAERKRVHKKFDLKYEPSKFTEELNDSRTGTSYIENMVNMDGSRGGDHVNADMGLQYKEYHTTYTRAQKSLIELNLSQPASPIAGELEVEGSVLTHPLNPSFKLDEDGGASEAPS